MSEVKESTLVDDSEVILAPTINVNFEAVDSKTVESLINELYDASSLYFQDGVDSPLTDDEFDSKLEYLKEIFESEVHEELFEEGSVGYNLVVEATGMGTIPASSDVEHKIPMLSLAKAKKPEELINFLTKARAAGAEDFRLQTKLDGFALSVEYNDGTIETISTRGTGTHGEDTTYLATSKDVSVIGLPDSIPHKGRLEVRGEIFFTNEQFTKVDDYRFELTGERFKNSRNSATGLMKKAKLGVAYPVEFTFSIYSVISDSSPKDLSFVDGFGFKTVDEVTLEAAPGVELTGFVTNDDVLNAVASFGKAREKFNFPTDGVVIKPKNESAMLAAMGYTSSHPASQIAWKYPGVTAISEILSIDLTVGKSGKITPIARLKPVSIDGSLVQNASLHNFNLIYKKNVRVGAVVKVEKANDIIPQLVSVISYPEGAELMEVPKSCPACAGALAFDENEKEYPPKTLRCSNVDCDSRNFFALKSAVGKNYLNIDGMSEVSLEHLHEVGKVNNIADLYKLEEKELADSQLGVSKAGNPRRLGEKRARHILDYIEASKTRPLAKVLPTLNIDLLGRSASRDLELTFGDIDGILNATQDEIEAIEGIGVIKAEKIYNGLKKRSNLIAQLRDAGVTFGKKTEEELSTSVNEESADNSLTGLSFAISGAVPAPFENRNAWVDYIEANGGEFHSGPKATTSFMVGDKEDTSSKIKKALKLELEFLTAEDFTSRFTG